MEFCKINHVEKRQGTFTDIPFDNNTFDMTYSCEALEHAIDIETSIMEMARVTKSGEMIAIIDKNKEKLGVYEIEEWEQWFDQEELKNIMQKYCDIVEVRQVSDSDEELKAGLFLAWIGKVK